MIQEEPLRDPIFKGCTRPAMVPTIEVPMGPYALVAIPIVLAGVLVHFAIVAALVPVTFIMREIVKKDDQQFRLLWLYVLCRWLNWDFNNAFWRASAYSPQAWLKRK